MGGRFVAVPLTIELVDVELVWTVEEPVDVVEAKVETEVALVELVDDTTTEDEVVGMAPCWYISSLFPAPQYSSEFPGHTFLQSVAGAKTLPALITLPQ